MVARILDGDWTVARMQMGFGKSSVVVPMLVARYVAQRAVRVVFVTQPAHLVPAAARAVGGLVAAHPFVREAGALVPVYAMGAHEFRAHPSERGAKFVVVMSTADMQRLVRDYPALYARSARAAHIADEVDAESDPLTCEVIVEGAETSPHYELTENVGAYYVAAYRHALGGAMDTARWPVGARLGDACRRLRGVVHRVSFGLSDDPSVLIAVPYPFANHPSPTATFADWDAAVAFLARSVAAGLRASDAALVERDITAKFGRDAPAILAMLGAGARAEYYATQIAMPRLRVSERERAVAFADLLGCADRFVGFSGTMGAAIAVPAFAASDARAALAARSIRVLEADDAALAREVILRSRCVCIGAERDAYRSGAVLTQIRIRIDEEGYAARPVLVVDASGEFGAFDDHLAAVQAALDPAGVGFFNDQGMLEGKDRRVRYYSHRDARGVDSDVGATAVAFVVISPATAYNAAVQAAFRLRRLRDGQEVVFISVEDEEDDGAGVSVYDLDARELLARLVANQARHDEAAGRVAAEQTRHAEKPKRSSEDFDRDARTKYAAACLGAQVQEKAQTQTRSRLRHASACYHAHVQGLRTLETAPVEIKRELDALGISLSPLLASGDTPAPMRAFAVLQNGHVAVMSIGEVWVVHEAERRAAYLAFTPDGVLLRSTTTDAQRRVAGAELLGRYLCDGALSIREEYALVRYLRGRYPAPEQRAALRTVVACLVGSNFLSAATLLLHELGERDVGSVGDEAGAEAAIFARLGSSPAFAEIARAHAASLASHARPPTGRFV
jgi:hypothetical protein